MNKSTSFVIETTDLGKTYNNIQALKSLGLNPEFYFWVPGAEWSREDNYYQAITRVDPPN